MGIALREQEPRFLPQSFSDVGASRQRGCRRLRSTLRPEERF